VIDTAHDVSRERADGKIQTIFFTPVAFHFLAPNFDPKFVALQPVLIR
jgi:hypothetical protein